MSVDEYFKNVKLMMETRSLWFDGEASVAWLTGLHSAKWVLSYPITPKVQKDDNLLDLETVLNRAADRLDETFWFGLLEKMDQSLEMLSFQLNWNKRLVLGQHRANNHTEATESLTTRIKSLIPKDLWLYQYATRLFDARWNYYKTGVFIPPKRPKLPGKVM